MEQAPVPEQTDPSHRQPGWRPHDVTTKPSGCTQLQGSCAGPCKPSPLPSGGGNKETLTNPMGRTEGATRHTSELLPELADSRILLHYLEVLETSTSGKDTICSLSSSESRKTS